MNIRGGLALICMVICLTLIGGWVSSEYASVYVIPIWFFGASFIALAIWSIENDW